MRLSFPSIILLLIAPAAFSQPLIEAANAHNLSKVKAILSSPADVDQRGPGGVTALMIAARTGDTPICMELLRHGADPNAKSDSAQTPLMEASRRGTYDIVDELLKKGGDPNVTARVTEESNGDPLFNSSLVLSGPSPRINAVEKSPLLLAVEGGHMAVVRLLLNHGADVNRQARWFVTISDSPYVVQGRSPLMSAVQQRFHALVMLIIERKPDVKLQEQAISMPTAAGKSENSDNAIRPLFVRHSTALHIAAEVSDTAIAMRLVEAGASLETRDGMDATPLAAAIKNGSTPVAELLIKRGADVNAGKNSPMSPLILAAERGKLRLVETLIRAGASIDQRAGESGSPLLACAATGGNRQVVRALLERGADVNEAASDNSTPLMVAAENGETDIVRFLISWKAKLDLRNREGQTALILASKHGRSECVRALLLAGADETLRDNRGKTALVYALEAVDQRTIRVLREGRSGAAGNPFVEIDHLSDLVEYFSTKIDARDYSVYQYLAFSKPYGKWDPRPLHVASLPSPDDDGTVNPREISRYVWKVIAHHSFDLPGAGADKVRDEFVREGFAHRERYCKNFFPAHHAALAELCVQAELGSRSIYVQEKELTRGEGYERVDNVYRQNGTFWRYAVPRGSPYQMSPRIDTLRGYQYSSSEESILRNLAGVGCYCLVKINGYMVFMTGGVLDNSIGFIYGKSRPRSGSLGPLFNLALIEDLGGGFYYYVSH